MQYSSYSKSLNSNIFYVSSFMRNLLCSILAMFASFVMASQVSAAQTVLQDIKVTAAGDRRLIDIDFGLPLLYVKHFPQKVGEILQIQLKLSDGNKRRIHKEVRQAGDIDVAANLESLLIYVTYEEGVPGGPYLTLRFSEPVEFEVQAGSSLQSLTIVVKTEQSSVESKQRSDFVGGKKLKSTKKSKRTKKSKQQKRRRAGGLDDRQIDEMMAKARQTLTFGDAKGAIELLRKIIRMPGSKHQQDARELLGLALERSNQIPRAKFEYKKYLRLYNKGDGANRVRQRLTALQNLGIQKKKKLRRTRRGRKDDRFKLFGRWSQSFSLFYVQSEPDDENLPDPGSFVASRISSSYLNLRGRYRGAKRNIQTVLAVNHTFDYRDRDKTNSRISYLNIDYDDFSQGLTVVLGRQRVRNGGVFGRFDGIIAGYRLSESIKPHLFFGEPVSFFESNLYKKRFWGFKVDLGKAKSAFNGNAYYVHQRVNKLHDRKAVGAVARFSTKGMTIFSLLDYDVEFKKLINGNVRFGWQFTPKAKFNVSFNDRSTLLTSNAIKTRNVDVWTGETTTNPDDLTVSKVYTPQQVLFDINKYQDAGLSEEDIMQIAIAESYRTQNATVGVTYQMDKDRQLNFDVSVFSSTGTKDIPNNLLIGTDFESVTPDELKDNKLPIELEGDALENNGTPGSGNQFLYSLQWILSNMFVERDLHVIGARYSKNEANDKISFYFRSRLPPVRNWNPRPSLIISRQKIADKKSSNDASGTFKSQGYLLSINPSLKIDYRWKKSWVFDIDLGIKFLDYTVVGNQDGKQISIRMSYHYTF